MTNTATDNSRRFTGWHMIAVMVLFFGTIITVNMIMAWQATSSWTGLVVKNSYVASQHFNENTQKRQAEIAMGWQSDITYEDGTFAIALKDSDGAVIDNAIVTAKLGRPAFEAEDRIVQMNESGSGRYEAQAALSGGVWMANFTVTGADGTVWTKPYRFFVKD
jgi:nitrogen fixation protein FixH